MGLALAWATGVQAAPTLSVQLAGGRTTFPKGSPVQISVAHAGTPRNASLVLTLVPDVADEAIRAYAGQGPIVMTSLPLGRAGRLSVPWDGRRLACAPSDIPEWCAGVDVGRYRVRAVIYDTGPFTTVGWPPRRRPVVLAQADSVPFYLTGEPDLQRLGGLMGTAAAQYGKAKLGIDRVKTYAPGWNEFSAVAPVARRDGRFCRDFDVAPPATGRISVCAPSSVLSRDGLRISLDDMAASGRLGWRWGVPDYQGAVRAALRVASPRYLDLIGSRDQNAPGHRGTYLSDMVQDIRFRPDLNAWLVEVAESEAGGTRRDRISDAVLVRVNANGQACVISTRPYQGGLRPNLRTIRVMC